MTTATVAPQAEVQKVSFGYHLKLWVLSFLKYFSLVFITFWILLPLVTCFFTAAKGTDEWRSTSVMTFPKNIFNFENYAEAFKLSRFQFPGNALIRTAFMMAALLPGIAMQVAVYKIMGTFHLINSLWGYIIMSMGTDVISIYIFIQYFENLSISLDEAALMDGASYFTIYSRILLPLLKPAIVTCLILKGVGIYNEYYSANLYLQDKQKLGTVAISLYAFTGPQGSKYNLICAGVIITLLPALIAFLIFQKQIYNGVAAGAVKE